MMKQHVYLIMDKCFSGDIWSLSRDRHIWICNSESKTPQIKAVWEKDSDYSQLKGITSFDIGNNPIEDFYKFLGTIDEHHSGNYNDLEAWSYIAVWGVDFGCILKEIIEKWIEVKVCLEKSEDHFIIKRIA